jgi:hypothetical protein
MQNPNPRIRLVRFGPLGCVVVLAIGLAIAFLLRRLIFMVIAIGAALVFTAVAARAGYHALGYRRELCPGCGRYMTVRTGAGPVRCPSCGMIHVFSDTGNPPA